MLTSPCRSLGLYLVAFLLCAAACLTRAGAADAVQQVLEGQRNFNAVQVVYRGGVPHTDARGRLLMQYDPHRSFFPRAAWGSYLPGPFYDYRSDWSVLRAAGLNAVFPWGAQLAEALQAAHDNDMQVVMGALTPSDVEAARDNPHLLGSVFTDEPIGNVGSADMDALWAQYQAYRERVKAAAPDLNVFISDAPWIMPPATSWWVKWNTAGDVSCHNNYPIKNYTRRAESLGADPNGIPQSVALAVAANQERKPVWLVVGAFTLTPGYGQAFPFRYPTPEQLRACVYAGIIHGATGIVYFIEDSPVSRDGGVIGMSPAPQATYTPSPQQEGYPKPTPATPLQLIQARALWETTTQVNRELEELTPAILSPTVGPEVAYTVQVEGEARTPTPIRALLKPHPEGGYVLLTVNLDDAVLRVTYQFPQALGPVQVLYENRLPETLPADARSFALPYEPFDVHVVRVRPAAGG